MAYDAKKEDRLMERLTDIKTVEKRDNDKIEDLINSTIRSHHKVYLAGDWHFWTKYKGERHSEKFPDGKCHERYNYNKVISSIKNTLKPDDLLIFLGDLVDGEFQEQDKLKELLKELIICKAVMVRGNNDLFTPEFYRECGFLYVVDSFVWGDTLFTHAPQEPNEYRVNVHSHIHKSMKYYSGYSNQIDIAYLDARITPVEMMKAIKSQKEYSKKITVVNSNLIEEQALHGIYEVIANTWLENDISGIT